MTTAADLLEVPAELRERPQWVAWRGVPKGGDGKLDKIPVDPRTGEMAKTNDPATWATFEDALAARERYGLAGVGYVFTAGDPFAGVDLDDCRDPDSGELTPWAQQIVDVLGSYGEVSPSGRGVKLWVRGTLPAAAKWQHPDGGGVELYDRGRFFTVTGKRFPDAPTTIRECQAGLTELYERVSGARSPNGRPRLDTAGVLGGVPKGARDDRLFRLACKLRRADVPQVVAERLVLEAAAKCDPPFPSAAALEKVESAYRYPTGSGEAEVETRLHRDAPWPEPPGEAAYHGLAGRIVEAVGPHTEADPVAVLAQLLVAFGAAVGSRPHAVVGATVHPARDNVALGGRTSKARKGDSLQPSQKLLAIAAPDFAARILGGLSSGEGLIWAVRDPIEGAERVKEKGATVRYERVVTDEGVADKRLLVIEPELARVLAVISRQGNTLSPVIRAAWDDGTLRVMTRTSPATATGAHVALIGHITVEELRRELTATDMANGLANRFIWLAVRRVRDLPEPEPFAGPIVTELATELADAIRKASAVGLMQRDEEARALWLDIYSDLAAERDGLAGAILARAEAHVLRLSMIYALLDGSSLVRVEHLAAALELWGYSERSVEYIFGGATGDPVADVIHEALTSNGELTKTAISGLFGRNESAARINVALQALLRRGRARLETRDSGGRPTEVWLPA